MAKVLFRWSLDKLVKTIVATLLNRFDFFVIIEGGTGIGKSSLAIRIAMKVKREFKKLYNLDEQTIRYYWENVQSLKVLPIENFITKILDLKEKNAYNFTMKNGLIYSQKAMTKFLTNWNSVGIPDEMINITYNRDFFSGEQKDIIKIINMHRDHCNLILSCVPQFQTLDVQIKNLCKMRLSVVRRGVAVIQTPNRTIHIKDKWDTATNEKIEREWLIRGDKTKPNYAKLTTTRGIVKFSALPKPIEEKYQKIKDEKRARILKEDMKVETEEKKSPEDDAYERLVNGGIKNRAMLEGIAMGLGMTVEQLISKFVRRLKEDKKPNSVAEYYWDKKEKHKIAQQNAFALEV